MVVLERQSSCFSDTVAALALVLFLACVFSLSAVGAVVVERCSAGFSLSSWISSILASPTGTTISCLVPGIRLVNAPPIAINVLEQTICQTVLLTAPLGALGSAKNQPAGPNQLCCPGGNQKMAVLLYQLVTTNGITVVTMKTRPETTMLKRERELARVELIVSRVPSCLSTDRRSFAHLAN